MNDNTQEQRVSDMPAEEIQQRPSGQNQKRKPVLSPELREVLHMLQSLEGKPATAR